MLESWLRPKFESVLVTPLAKSLQGICSPNQVTLFALLCGILVLAALALQHPMLALGLLWLSGYADMLDGSIARLTNSNSDHGSMLDIIADRIVECAVIIGLWTVAPDARSLLCLLMLSSVLVCVTSFLVVGIFTQNQSAKQFHYHVALIERGEAFLFFSAMILWPTQFNWLAVAFCSLVVVSALQHAQSLYSRQRI